MDHAQGLYANGDKFKPTFRFDTEGALWLQVLDGFKPVSDWLGAFAHLVG
jgi:hypothetical protein